MGNQVIFSVPLKNIEKLKKISFRYAVSSMNDLEITALKTLNGFYPENKKGLNRSTGIHLCSGAYHSSDCANLYLDSNNIFYFPAFYKELNENKDDYVSTLISNYKDDNPQVSVTKLNQKQTKELSSDEKYVVFGFLTDSYSSITDQDFHNALEAANQIPVFKDGSFVSAHQHKHSEFQFEGFGEIIPLGCFSHDSFVMITLKHNVFYMGVYPKYKELDLEDIQITEIDKNSSPFENRIFLNALRRKVVENIGYKVEVKK